MISRLKIQRRILTARPAPAPGLSKAGVFGWRPGPVAAAAGRASPGAALRRTASRRPAACVGSGSGGSGGRYAPLLGVGEARGLRRGFGGASGAGGSNPPVLAARVCALALRWPPGLAGSLGRSGRGAAKSSDPVGVAGRQKLLGVAHREYEIIKQTCWESNLYDHGPKILSMPLSNGIFVWPMFVLLYNCNLLGIGN